MFNNQIDIQMLIDKKNIHMYEMQKAGYETVIWQKL